MEQTVQILIALVSGGALVKLIDLGWSRWRRTREQAGSFGELGREVRELVLQTIEDETEKAGLRKQVEVKDGAIAEFRLMVKDVLIDHGVMKERERRCQQEINAIKERLDGYDEMLATHTALSDRVMQQSAILTDLRRQGLWTGDQSLTEPI